MNGVSVNAVITLSHVFIKRNLHRKFSARKRRTSFADVDLFPGKIFLEFFYEIFLMELLFGVYFIFLSASRFTGKFTSLWVLWELEIFGEYFFFKTCLKFGVKKVFLLLHANKFFLYNLMRSIKLLRHMLYSRCKSTGKMMHPGKFSQVYVRRFVYKRGNPKYNGVL